MFISKSFDKTDATSSVRTGLYWAVAAVTAAILVLGANAGEIGFLLELATSR